MAEQTPSFASRWPGLTVWLAAVVLALLCITSVRAQVSATPTPAIAGDTRQVTVVPAASDSQISTRLADILRATGWFETPSVVVTDGVAFIDGATDTQDRRVWAGNLADNTEGVVAVVNRITINADVRSTFDRAVAESADLAGQALQTWPLVLLAVVIIAFSWLVSLLVAAVARRLLTSRIASPLLLGVVVRTIAIPV